MDIRKTLHVNSRKHWHEWLESNFGSEKEIWLVYPSKQSGKPRISYNDAVEEALSFGWIDSTVKRVDGYTHFVYTVRHKRRKRGGQIDNISLSSDPCRYRPRHSVPERRLG